MVGEDTTTLAKRKTKRHMTINDKPVAGTFTFTAHVGRKTGVSDPIPNNCTTAQANAAFIQAYKRAGMIIPANKLTAAALAAIASAVRAARSTGK